MNAAGKQGAGLHCARAQWRLSEFKSRPCYDVNRSRRDAASTTKGVTA